MILPKNANDYYSIDNFGNYPCEFLILFSKKQIDINAIIQSHQTEKFGDLKSFVRSVFQDNLVASDLTIGNDEDFFFYENKMNATLTNDNNFILPIIIGLKEKPEPEPEIPETKKKKRKN